MSAAGAGADGDEPVAAPPAVQPRPRIVLDCDPGHDDALAIAVAGRHADLLGITTVAGNVPLPLTTRNTLAMVEVLGLDVPVHAGSPRPIVAEPRTAEFIHGSSGLDGPALPEHRRGVDSRDAVRFLVDTVRAHDDVWIVATGPLTNVALAMRSAPDIVERLGGVAFMGGGTTFGNVTAAAEFNILVDPEAAAIVVGSGVELIMAGLNVTHGWMIDEAVTARIRERGGVAAGFCAALLDYYGDAYARAFSGRRAGPLHDPCAVLALTHPALFERQAYHVEVETQGVHTRGMTVVDQRGVHRSPTPNVHVLTRIDADAATELLIETLATYD